MSKVVLITGCSSGIGLSAAVLLAKNNYKVYATLRDLSRKDKLEQAAREANVTLDILQLDVTDDNSVKNAVRQIIEREGRIEILINNAGYGLRGTVENVTIDEVKQQFDTNFFGLLRVTQEVLPHMRNQKSGHIINISSLAGVRGMTCSDIYCATKFAVEAVSESMAAILPDFGIKVTVVEPGPVATDFLERSLKYGTRLEGQENPYREIMEATVRATQERFKNAQSSEDVAQLIKEIIENENPHFRYQTREDGNQIAAIKFKDITGDSVVEAARKQLKETLEKDR